METYFDIQWRHWQLSHDGRKLHFDRTSGGPHWPIVYFEIYLGRLCVRYGR